MRAAGTSSGPPGPAHRRSKPRRTRQSPSPRTPPSHANRRAATTPMTGANHHKLPPHADQLEVRKNPSRCQHPSPEGSPTQGPPPRPEGSPATPKEPGARSGQTRSSHHGHPRGALCSPPRHIQTQLWEWNTHEPSLPPFVVRPHPAAQHAATSQRTPARASLRQPRGEDAPPPPTGLCPAARLGNGEGRRWEER